MIDKYVSEIWAEMAMATTRTERLKILDNHRGNREFIATLTNMFHPHVNFLFDDIPAYKPLVVPVEQGMIPYNEALRRCYLFIKGDPNAPAGLTQAKRNNLLIQILESLPDSEARVFVSMLKKKTSISGFTRGLVKEAYPNLVPWSETTSDED